MTAGKSRENSFSFLCLKDICQQKATDCLAQIRCQKHHALWFHYQQKAPETFGPELIKTQAAVYFWNFYEDYHPRDISLQYLFAIINKTPQIISSSVGQVRWCKLKVQRRVGDLKILTPSPWTTLWTSSIDHLPWSTPIF